MTLKSYENEPLPFDNEVYEEINTHLTLNKGKFNGSISCSDYHLKQIKWDSDNIKKHICKKSEVLKIFEVWKFIETIEKAKEDILYIPFFECDTRCYNGDRGELRIEDKEYIDRTLNQLNENIEKLWKSKGSFLFVLPHKMFKTAHQTRYFKWMMKNSEKHHYKIYGISPTKIPGNPMRFISQ